MLIKFLTKIFGSRNERILNKMRKIVNMINAMEPKVKILSDKDLKGKTYEFRQRIKQGEKTNDLIPEAFAVVREASIRILGMRHFDVQLLGGIVLNERCIAEIRTGEGKTLTATLPAYLNALSGKSVHIVTANDYLAQRDAKKNNLLFEFLGMTVGINLPGMSILEKQKAYAADITYGTNNEYGFDYLRDNMAFRLEDRVQSKLHYALIDEVDSILIDEARTPLIISGPIENSSEIYLKINKIVPYLLRQEKEDSSTFRGNGHFSVDEKTRQIYLTERGLILIEEFLVKEGIIKKHESLYSSNNIILMHYIIAVLRAHLLFIRDVDYLVKDGKIIIVDEHTGRIMHGHRWSDGLHQAVEAKEGVKIHNENQTLASITFQNYFRLYEKLAGMTGTADSEAFEFSSIYKLDTVVIPTNRPMIRKDLPDLVYITELEKIQAIINDIRKCITIGQPVLVGTISIEKSELISNALKNAGIKHNVLNAKFHAKEADIIAQAGYPSTVTIATNMAGRGTDIMLGGNWQSELSRIKNPSFEQIKKIKANWKIRHKSVILAGGLHIIGTERHESRRIDNQLRGRAGRQGDPGSSRFYLSMEDSLMRIFASNRVSIMMRKLGMKPGEAIEHPWITKAIANAQRKVENRNFNIRKQLIEYDDVINDQRRIIYAQRDELLRVSNIGDTINKIRKDVLKKIVNKYIISQFVEDLSDVGELQECLKNDFKIDLSIKEWINKELKLDKSKLFEYILYSSIKIYQDKEKIIGIETLNNLERGIMLHALDSLWKEHLAAIDYLRQGIYLRGYAQKDPKQEYKNESFNMFTSMLEELKYEVISTLSKFLVSIPEKSNLKHYNYNKSEIILNLRKYNHDSYKKESDNIFNKNYNRKIGRNDPCPCGSNKKYKQCHGLIS